MNSVFQLVEQDSVAFALYRIDTLSYPAPDTMSKIIVYQFSTDFGKEWNEDFANYFLYYTSEFGVVDVVSVSSFPVHWQLLDNCIIKGKRKDDFKRFRSIKWRRPYLD